MFRVVKTKQINVSLPDVPEYSQKCVPPSGTYPDPELLSHLRSMGLDICPPVRFGCVRANACKEIWWDPSQVKAGIVTCGGLCPGLNSIIREVARWQS